MDMQIHILDRGRFILEKVMHIRGMHLQGNSVALHKCLLSGPMLAG